MWLPRWENSIDWLCLRNRKCSDLHFQGWMKRHTYLHLYRHTFGGKNFYLLTPKVEHTKYDPFIHFHIRILQLRVTRSGLACTRKKSVGRRNWNETTEKHVIVKFFHERKKKTHTKQKAVYCKTMRKYTEQYVCFRFRNIDKLWYKRVYEWCSWLVYIIHIELPFLPPAFTLSMISCTLCFQFTLTPPICTEKIHNHDSGARTKLLSSVSKSISSCRAVRKKFCFFLLLLLLVCLLLWLACATVLYVGVLTTEQVEKKSDNAYLVIKQWKLYFALDFSPSSLPE